MTNYLPMEIRSVDMDGRQILGQVAVWNETSYMVPDPGGERLMVGCFRKSIQQRGTRIPLCVNHDHSRAVGMSRSWTDSGQELAATFAVRPGEVGDQALEDARDGYLPGLSAGFLPLNATRGRDGALEVREAKLAEVSLVLIGAYDGSRVLAVRSAQDLDAMLAPFKNPPAVDLSPVPPIWAYDRTR